MLILRILLFTIAFLPFYTQIEAGFWDNLRGLIWKTPAKTTSMIDVLIVNDQPQILIEVSGRYQLMDPNTKKLIGKRYLGKKKNIQALASGLKWGEEFPGIYQLQIIPEDSITVNGVAYRGMLFVYDIGGSISIVNRVPIEEYLLSTLPSRYQKNLPEEALSAIAITARTEAFYQTLYPRSKFWAVDGIREGYKGLESHITGSKIERAIRATRYMILSKTGAYEGVFTPFPACWDSSYPLTQPDQKGTVSRISIKDAEKMATSGQHAAQILSKAFPGSHIEILR